MASDWWSRKLSGNQPPSPPTRSSSLPPSSAPVRIGQQLQFPRTQAPEHSERLLDDQRPATQEINMGDAIRLWRGGEAARKEGNMYCPECGSQHVFSRTGKGANTTIQGKAPAPRCFECGWTGLYTQGVETTWVN